MGLALKSEWETLLLAVVRYPFSVFADFNRLTKDDARRPRAPDDDPTLVERI